MKVRHVRPCGAKRGGIRLVEYRYDSGKSWEATCRGYMRQPEAIEATYVVYVTNRQRDNIRDVRNHYRNEVRTVQNKVCVSKNEIDSDDDEC